MHSLFVPGARLIPTSPRKTGGTAVRVAERPDNPIPAQYLPSGH